MALATGARLGPYEIVAPAGAGGMGEVYRARDSKLGRAVAIKILDPTYSTDPERLRRFEQEARAASALNHPNLTTIHDVGSENGTAYLAMEFVEGKTLRELLSAGPLPLKKALAIAAQVAEGLAKAHSGGIVHRDLKPENVMVTGDGLVKVLDFGLAKLAAVPAEPTSRTATAVALGTGPGIVLGTVSYMSPEQARGAAVDFRSDQFSLGTMLFEMLTGKRPFERGSSAQTMAAIIDEEPPPVGELNPKTPAPARWIIERCLAKEPDERYASTRDLARDLHRAREFLSEAGAANGAFDARSARTGKGRTPFLRAAVAALAIAAFFAGSYLLRRSDSAPPVFRAALMPPRGHSYVAYDIALSPDGTRLAFPATSADGITTLWVKSLRSGSDQEFAHTEGAAFPFWSPDGRQLGFFTGGKLKKLDLASGDVQIICDAQRGRGGTWGPDGTIVFAPQVGAALEKVPAAGGVPLPAAKLPPGRSESHRWPTFLPDGRHFLYAIDWSQDRNGVYVGSLDSEESRRVSGEIFGNVEFAAGHLLFVRDGTLFAQPFDADQMQLKGIPVPIVSQELEQDLGFVKAGFTVSRSGALVYQSRKSYSSRLLWFDRTGKELEAVGDAGSLTPSLSPNGRSLAVVHDSASNGHTRVHVIDLVRGTSTALTPPQDRNEAVTWSPDSTRVAYGSFSYGKNGRETEVRVRAADGTGEPQVLVKGPRLMVNDWSRDGRHLMYMNFEKGFPELWTYDFTASKASPLGMQAAEGQLSPDGRWLAMTMGGRLSRPQIFIRRFPELDAQVQVSTNGGAQARWRSDGKELYYIADDKRLMAVSVKPGPNGLEVGTPTPLFQTRMHGARYTLFQYAISADGQRFLVNSLPREDAAAPMMLLTDWTAELKR